MAKEMTSEEAKAFVLLKALEERARKKKEQLQWRPPTREELEKRRGKLK